MHVDVEWLVPEVEGHTLLADAVASMEALGLQAAELSVLLVDDARIADLNLTWRGKDSATDVLSFPQQSAPVSGGLLGDIVMSVPTAEAQAAEQGHALVAELRVLLVHGLCHLVGHDHHEEVEREAMRGQEQTLLRHLGVTLSGGGLVERAGPER
jgi:probable rRNA maturation factor